MSTDEPSIRDRSKENAPSRWSLRPTIRLTFAEATVTRRVINLRHSVLGASRTLGGSDRAVKTLGEGLVANCEVFFAHRVELRMPALALVSPEKKNGRARWPGRKVFAEPGTLSSTFPTNLPLSRCAPRGASSYRRPVLGAAALYANPDLPIKSRAQENRRNLRPISRGCPQARPVVESGPSIARV